MNKPYTIPFPTYPKHYHRILNANSFWKPKLVSWYVSFVGVYQFHMVRLRDHLKGVIEEKNSENVLHLAFVYVVR